MKRDMKSWVAQQISAPRKKAMPVLSFPCVQLMGVTVDKLVVSSDLQAQGMKLVADRTDSGAAMSMMDLSVEAEAFGAQIRFSDMEVPSVIGRLIESMEDAENLQVPEVGAGRTGIYVEAISKAAGLIEDRPVLAGMIGPFSLAGRLLDVTEALVSCYTDPDLVHAVMRKATDFLVKYAVAYKDAGANGIVVAEPLAGLLSPDLLDEFAQPYMKELTALSCQDFIVVYHNCGGETVRQAESIFSLGADAYHFGNAVDMSDLLPKAPKDVLVMGNVDPAGQLRGGTPESVYSVTRELLDRCGSFDNFIISSGCDVPPAASWDNIDAFYRAVDDYYNEKAGG